MWRRPLPSPVLGLFAAWGLPGGWPLIGLVALLLHMRRCAQSGDLRTRLAHGLLFSLGAAPSAAIGAWFWGFPVVALFAGIICLWFLPLSIIAAPSDGSRMATFLWRTCAIATSSQLLNLLGVPSAPLTATATELFTPAIWGARLIGSSLTEGLLFATMAGVAEASVEKSRSTWAIVGVGTASLFSLSLLARLQAPPREHQVTTGIVQVHADPVFYRSRMSAPKLSVEYDRRLQTLLAKLSDVDLLVFPESHDGGFSWLLPRVQESLRLRARTLGQSIIYTSYLESADGKKLNAAIGINNNGQVEGTYEKSLPAPFGESGLAKGIGGDPFSLGPAKVGILICNESIVGARSLTELESSNLLAVPNSDVTFRSSLAPYVHLALARVLSIEVGRNVIWAGNAGPSGVIDRWGDMEVRSPLRMTAAVRSAASIHSDITPFLRTRLFWQIVPFIGVVLLFTRRPASSNSPRPAVEGSSAPVVIFSLTFAFLAAPLVPASVEWRHGSSDRALTAVRGQFDRDRTLTAPQQPLDGQSMATAVRRTLSYLGAPSPQVAPLRSQNLTELAQELTSKRLLNTESSLLSEPAAVPRLAVSKDGIYGVVLPDEDDAVRFLGPNGTFLWTKEEAEQLLEPSGLRPVLQTK